MYVEINRQVKAGIKEPVMLRMGHTSGPSTQKGWLCPTLRWLQGHTLTKPLIQKATHCLTSRICSHRYLEALHSPNSILLVHISKSHSMTNWKEWQLLTHTRAYIGSTVYHSVLPQLCGCFSASCKPHSKGFHLYLCTLMTFWSPERPLRNTSQISYLLALKSIVFGWRVKSVTVYFSCLTSTYQKSQAVQDVSQLKSFLRLVNYRTAGNIQGV